MAKIIETERSIVPAWNVKTSRFRKVLQGTANVEGIGAYMIGAVPILEHGLPEAVERAREVRQGVPLLYNHGGLGSDFEQLQSPVFQEIKRAGVEAVVLTGLAGPSVLSSWIRAAQTAGLEVVLEQMQPHSGFLSQNPMDTSDVLSGYLLPKAIIDAHKLAVSQGVRMFILPGESAYLPDFVEQMKGKIKATFKDRDCTVHYRSTETGKLERSPYHEINGVDVMEHGLGGVLFELAQHNDKSAIIDWQSLGTYTPNRAAELVGAVLKAPMKSSVRAIRVLPLSGSSTLDAISEAAGTRVKLLVEAHRGNEDYTKSNGGFLTTETPEFILSEANAKGTGIMFPSNRERELKAFMETHPNAEFFIGGSSGSNRIPTDRLLPRSYHRVIGSALVLNSDSGAIERLADSYVQKLRS
ncbi:MAG: hypothetical protein ABIA93_02710 [Candidatus Woesearchaeota archaeon]